MPTRTMRRAYGLTILNSQHSEIRRLKREGNIPEIHGNKFWNSSFLIMDYLKRNPPRKQTRVLEIGCGWGLLGLYCAKTFGCPVHGIDADENVLPYLELHAGVNGVTMSGEKKTFEALTTRYLSDFDLILGADICFWDEMAGVLLNLIGRAGRAGVSQIMIADPCRPPFNDLVARATQRYDNVRVEERAIKRPVPASGEILIVSP